MRGYIYIRTSQKRTSSQHILLSQVKLKYTQIYVQLNIYGPLPTLASTRGYCISKTLSLDVQRDERNTQVHRYIQCKL